MNNLIVRLAQCAQVLENANMVHDASILDAVVVRLSQFMEDDGGDDFLSDGHDEMREHSAEHCERCGHDFPVGSGMVLPDYASGDMLCKHCRKDGHGGDMDDIDRSPQGYL